MRQIAWVAEDTTPNTIHRLSAWTDTPSEKSGDAMPIAAVLILDEADNGVYLLRYASDGQFAGDTWHETIDDAKHQATFEYGTVEWTEGPPGPAQVDDYAIACLADRKR